VLTIEKYAELWVALAAGTMAHMNAESEEAAVDSAANVATALMQKLERKLEELDEVVNDPEDALSVSAVCPYCGSSMDVFPVSPDSHTTVVVCNSCSKPFLVVKEDGVYREVEKEFLENRVSGEDYE
jgi:hypothetical protein